MRSPRRPARRARRPRSSPGKPLRAPLLLAVVAVVTPDHPKVPEWEQEASAAGVAHLMSLLLDEAGWGVMWRTGPYTRHPIVEAAHGLVPGERLLGWLYVGGLPGRAPRRAAHRPRRGDPADHAGLRPSGGRAGVVPRGVRRPSAATRPQRAQTR